MQTKVHTLRMTFEKYGPGICPHRHCHWFLGKTVWLTTWFMLFYMYNRHMIIKYCAACSVQPIHVYTHHTQHTYYITFFLSTYSLNLVALVWPIFRVFGIHGVFGGCGGSGCRLLLLLFVFFRVMWIISTISICIQHKYVIAVFIECVCVVPFRVRAEFFADDFTYHIPSRLYIKFNLKTQYLPVGFNWFCNLYITKCSRSTERIYFYNHR